MRNLFTHAAAAALALVSGGTPALAQMQLPGAVQGHAPITHGGERPSATGVAVRAPAETTLIGRELRLNGTLGLISFQKQGADLTVNRIVLGGEKISNRREACRVEVEGGPFTAAPEGRKDGLKRYAVSIAACPFSFVVLDQAILATVAESATPAQPPASARPDSRAGSTAGMCSFTQADCVVHIGGVWGPAAASITAAEAQQILKARSAAEKNALANYRALVAQAGKDRTQVRAVAAEQASFSSKRSELCYDYSQEDVHGFCSARLTEAHAVALRAKLNPAAFEAENNAPERKPAPRPRPKPPQEAGSTPPGLPTSIGGPPR